MKYVSDNLVKYTCFHCDGEFILSEYIVEHTGEDVCCCPYCKSHSIEAVSECREDLLDEFGCFGIYHYE